MCGEIEFGKCEICGKEAPLVRTYFVYAIPCECCGCIRNGAKCHFEMVRHCGDCPAPMPKVIHPFVKAMDGKSYRADISNILPIEVNGEFIIDGQIIGSEQGDRGEE